MYFNIALPVLTLTTIVEDMSSLEFVIILGNLSLQ